MGRIKRRRKCRICGTDKPDVPKSRVHPQCQKRLEDMQARMRQIRREGNGAAS